MKKLFLILLILFLSSCASQENVVEEEIQEIQKNTSEEIIIVSYGDSLTNGYGVNRDEAYPAVLEDLLIEDNYNVKVYNSGIDGETTTAALERINWVLQLNPDIVIMEYGANDAFSGKKIEDIEKNLAEMISIFKENNVIVILTGMQIVRNLGEEYANNFKAMYPRLAQNHSVYFVKDFLGGVGGISDLNQEDEIHPKPEGHRIIAENNIYPVVIEVLENENFN